MCGSAPVRWLPRAGPLNRCCAKQRRNPRKHAPAARASTLMLWRGISGGGQIPGGHLAGTTYIGGRPLVTRDGTLYISGMGNKCVQKWPPGELVGIAVFGGDRDDQLDTPWGLVVTEDADIYVAELGSRRVTKWREGWRSGMVVAGGGDTPHSVFRAQAASALGEAGLVAGWTAPPRAPARVSRFGLPPAPSARAGTRARACGRIPFCALFSEDILVDRPARGRSDRAPSPPAV